MMIPVDFHGFGMCWDGLISPVFQEGQQQAVPGPRLPMPATVAVTQAPEKIFPSDGMLLADDFRFVGPYIGPLDKQAGHTKLKIDDGSLILNMDEQ